jgi:hypothetical protein
MRKSGLDVVQLQGGPDLHSSFRAEVDGKGGTMPLATGLTTWPRCSAMKPEPRH